MNMSLACRVRGYGLYGVVNSWSRHHTVSRTRIRRPVVWLQ